MILESITFAQYRNLFNSASNRKIYLSVEWLIFLEKTKKLKLIFILFSDDKHRPLFVFVGGLFSKFGIKILGSPFEGWDTENMGFLNLSSNNVDYQTAFFLLKNYLSKEYHCHYFEIVDNDIPDDVVNLLDCSVNVVTTPMLDLSRTENDIFSSFDTDVRTSIRNFERKGGTIQILSPTKDLLNEFYSQTVCLYQRKGMKSIFSLGMFQNMFDAFSSLNERCLCVAAYEPKAKKCIAIIVSVCLDGKAYAQCISDYHDFLTYRPIEALIWFSIKYWKNKGAKSFDLAGSAHWKKKFEPKETKINRLIFSKNKLLVFARNFVKRILLLKRGKKQRKMVIKV